MLVEWKKEKEGLMVFILLPGRGRPGTRHKFTTKQPTLVVSLRVLPGWFRARARPT
jgi:hypothetical protein